MVNTKLIKHIIKIFFLGVIFIFVCACANIVPPSGGAKDTTPPKLIKTEPQNHSIRFNSHTIRIVFDEYIKLSNLNQQLMISPPLQNNPDVTVRGKSLLIKINDTLSENTTYNFYFGNAIVDITEGNAYANFSYVFSTGDILDSMSVKGNVFHAADLKPAEEVFVMLYDSICDSLPYLQKPSYLTKTDKLGRFQLNNLRDINYKIFALTDANFNLIYDLPNEKIAFLDSVIKPVYIEEKRLRNIISDSTAQADTVKTDTILQIDSIPPTVNDTTINEELKLTTYALYMFEEKDKVQKVIKKSLDRKGLLSVVFRYPVHDFRIVYPLISNPENVIIEEFNKTKDTLNIWIKDSEMDTLYALLYQNDSVLDTLNINIVPRASKRPVTAKLIITPNFINNSTFDYFLNPVLNFNNPITSFNIDSLVFTEDSIPIIPQFEFNDSAKRQLKLTNILSEDTEYELFIPSNSFVDIFKSEHDSLKIKFKTKKKEDYGKLTINIQLPDENHAFIIYLLDEKGKIFREDIINNSQKLEYPNMNPGKFSVKVIFDNNNDGKWTTGNYIKKIQPEKVFLSKGEIVTRANWDVEVEVVVN